MIPAKPFDNTYQHVSENRHVVNEHQIDLGNGYSIKLWQEKIPRSRRSVYRGLDTEQVVLTRIDPNGKVTNRLGIPAGIAREVAQMLAGAGFIS